MKTPTMLYLAYHGWFAANVPIVPGSPPDPSVLGLPHELVFGLYMSAAAPRRAAPGPRGPSWDSR